MSADPALDQSALTEPKGQRSTLGAWFAFVRRARVGGERKKVLMVVGSYANNDGSAVRCGVAGLAVDCEIGYSTARRYLAWMREVQLIELVKPGNPRKGLADVYRLTLGPKSKALALPDEEYEALKDEMREANRAGQKARRIADQRSPKTSAETTAESADSSAFPEGSALTMPSAETADQRSPGGRSALTQGERPPPHYTSPVRPSSPSGGAPPPDPRRPDAPPTSGHRNEQLNSFHNGDQLARDPRTTTHAARGTAAVGQPTADPAEIETSGQQPRQVTTPRREGRCPHGRNSRRNHQGQPRCDQCREAPEHTAEIIPFPLASGGSP